MNNATTIVALITKCDLPAAKERCERAYQRASNLETPASDLDTLARMEYADTIKVHRAIIGNPNVDKDTVQWLFAHHHPRQFEIACGFILNPALPSWLRDDPRLAWLSTAKLAHLAAVADAMQDYPKYINNEKGKPDTGKRDHLKRTARIFANIVQNRKHGKEEAA
jgi:hypothetical protein